MKVKGITSSCLEIRMKAQHEMPGRDEDSKYSVRIPQLQIHIQEDCGSHQFVEAR